MKYLLTLYRDESQYAGDLQEQMHQSMLAWDAYTRDVIASASTSVARGSTRAARPATVKIEPSGDHIVSDGPFAETREQLGGYYLLDCART